MIIKKEGKYLLYVSESKDGCASLFCDEQWFLTNHQVHGSRITKITNATLHKNGSKKSDWIITNLRHQKIGVRVADCNAIILMGKEWFSVIHAWWRWLYKKILQKAIKRLEEEGENVTTMKIYVGPSIRSCCYEVGSELHTYFKKKYMILRAWKWYLDMLQYIIDVLIEKWIKRKNIHIDTHCTKCDPWFFSYRWWNNQQRIIIGVEKK